MIEILFNIIIFPIIQILELSFTLAHKLFIETGISVIFISIVISVLCLPLYLVAEKWQNIERDTVKNLKKKADRIKKAFKGDEQFMILSTYYRQNNYHPIYALRSSFSILIQIPFFIAAYYYLSHLELLNGVSFIFIDNLGAPDAFLSAGRIKINILPIIMTVISFASSFIYTRGLSARDKLQLYGMAALFLILLYNSPSALVLYWIINNIFSLLKYIYFIIPYKYKHFILLGFFSLCFFVLAVFCRIKYGYNPKGQRIFQLFIFISVFPWIIFLFKKKLSEIFSFQYESKKSLYLFLTSILLVWCVLGFFIPSQLIVSSPQEFSYLDNYNSPLYFLLISSLKSFGLFVFYPLCLYFLFSNKIKTYFSILFPVLSIIIIFNTFMFPGDYGNISLDFIFSEGISHSNIEIILNLLISLFILAAVFLLYFRKNKNLLFIPLVLSIFSLTVISCVNIYRIQKSYYDLGKYYVKDQNITADISPIFSLSRNGKNVVLIMLDRCISGFFPYILDESPELRNIYSGFTYYPNTISFNGYTLISSSAVFGGYEYSPLEMNKREDILLADKHNEALLLLPRILSDRGFNITVTDPPYAGYNWISDLTIYDNYPNVKAYITDSYYTDIWLEENNLNLPLKSAVVKRNMFLYSILRGLPLFFRNPIYMEGNWFLPFNIHTLRLTLDGYAVLDYLPRLTEIKDDASENALIMVNNTTHKSVFLQAPDYVPSANVTNYGVSRFKKVNAYHTTTAAIKRISAWLQYLKNENLYDNTKIIIFSDHGPEQNLVNKIGLDFNLDQFNAFLICKDFNSSGDIKFDASFMSNADVPFLTLNGLIENPVNPFTGNVVSNSMKDEPLYINMWRSTHNTIGNEYQFGINSDYDYYVHSNIFIKENWKKQMENN